MNKFHSLQKRRLGLEMTGIRKEHARHVKRVRVEIREAGTLASQYEDEKERRARHLLKTFSKVQRKRQATEDWKTAVRQRNNSVATPSPTFDVEIGAKEAPWGGTGRSLSSRRKSSTGSFSSMRARHGSRASSLGSIKGGAAGAKAQPRRVSGLFGSPARLPPIGRGGMSQYMTLATIPIFLNTWQTALGRRQSQAGAPDEDADSHVTVAVDGDARGNEFVNDDDQLRLDNDGSPERTAARADPGPLKRKVYWTETFPFVYHSVGETVCPRYHKLFHQYEEFKVRLLDGDFTRRLRLTEVEMRSVLFYFIVNAKCRIIINCYYRFTVLVIGT